MESLAHEALKKTRKIKTTIDILNHGQIKNGFLQWTDTDMWYNFKIDGAENQFVNLEKFRKSGRVDISSVNDKDEDQFPNFPVLFGKKEIPEGLMNLSIGMDVFCSNDDITRVSFTTVYFSSKNKEVVSTNGNILCLKKFYFDLTKDFHISYKYVNFIKWFIKKFPKARYYTDGKFVKGSFEGNCFLIRQREDFLYPNYKKVIPEKDVSFTLNASEFETFQNNVKECFKLSGKNTSLIYVDKYFVLKNDGKYSAKFLFHNNPLKDAVIFNVYYMKNVLSVFNDPSVLSCQFENVGKLIFYAGDILSIIMPMRIRDYEPPILSEIPDL